MTGAKVIRLTHLWLGLLSGIVMFTVCLTGAVWVFNEEISRLTGDIPDIPVEERPLLPPSRMAVLCEQQLNRKAAVVDYILGKPARIASWSAEHSVMLLVDPYSGKILKTIDYRNGFDFFAFLLNGHRFLWLPWKIGRPVVNYGTLTFFAVLVSGLLLRFPRTRKAVRGRVCFRWTTTTGRQRKIYDLHTILGFHAVAILSILALTGMMWGIEWYSESVYKLTSRGNALPGRTVVRADISALSRQTGDTNAVDEVFRKLVLANPKAARFSFMFPDRRDSASLIRASVYPDAARTYNKNNYAFDPCSLTEIPLDTFNGLYADAKFADKLRRMNYDIHTGAVGGLLGKTIAFFAALIGASLPVTGFYLWFAKRKKRRRKITRDTR